ncbi:alpha-L-fucosidase [Niabella sp. CC-SYL272]|uniref:alpha-L-fucosidase n=1 Tax=Niabella agricola TaxID=2891571 RepID=UPI001F1E1F3D|nr:alpha-L-fucosidase [Niabella agricola]MCF3109992.1 alpha-L-fucosidase [Niabella agricola]
MKKIVISSFFCMGLWVCGFSQKVPPPAPVHPVPSARQLAWHQLETYAFIHFTTNTFTDKEWGFGDEDPKIFNPTKVDAGQWASVLKQTGFKAMILTTKHHDGFTLWPSKYTEHSVKNSSWKNGKGDVVKEASDAARKAGLKFGVYLSPWDRNRSDYGTPSYITYYRNQLKELFTNYGPIFEMWFDGANGGDGYYGGTREKRKINGATYYDWPTTLKLVRSMQPQVLFFSDAGPDIRWVGNERGIAGETNWNSITPDTLYAGKAGIEKLLNTGSADGTRWIPAEVDVSIRPGWFYHASEDSKVKTPEQLFEIYLSSVGRGSNLLLNIPPDRNGVFHPTDVASLQGFKKLLDERLTSNLAKNAKVVVSNTRGNAAAYNGAKITDGNNNTYWATDDGITSGEIEIHLLSEKKISYILLQEYIALGQRVRSFTIEAAINGSWKEIASGTTIGYKRILKIDPISTRKLRVRIADAKACPLISNLAVY